MTTPVTGQGALSIPVTAAVLFAGGEMGSIKNPEGATVVITRAVLYTTTASTTAGATIAIGTAADAVTEGTNLANEIAIDAGAAGAVNLLGYQAAGDALVVWTSAQYITCTGSAASTAFAGKLYVEYVRV